MTTERLHLRDRDVAVRCAMHQLWAAAGDGIPLVLFVRGELIRMGYAERFTDTSRVLSDRVRLTELGRTVMRTLVLPKERDE